MGRGRVIGEALVNHPGVAAISFTGSVGVGRGIAAACVASGKKVQLEMGGKNPQVVLDDADLKQAVELSAQSCFYSTGQRCTASSRIIVTDKIYPAFVEAIKVGAALAAGTDMGPVVSQGQLEQDLSYVEIGKAEGGNLVSGGSRIACHTGSGHEGYFMAPALFADTVPAMRINREEIFGPVASVIRVKDYEEALHVANDTEFGLSAGIATTTCLLGGARAPATGRASRDAMPRSSSPPSRQPTRWPDRAPAADRHGQNQIGLKTAPLLRN